MWCAFVSTFVSLQCLLLYQATFGSKGIQRLHGLQGWHTVSFTRGELSFAMGIKIISCSPMWEDDINKNGGRWVMFLDKDSKEFVNKLWHDLVSS